MKVYLAFMKKEILEQIRSGRVMLLGLLFLLFGIMNPAVAKLTPWLLENMSESLAASGMIITSVTVTAMDSWVQFYKNIPMALIAFLLIQSSIFTREYETGTLILSLTKGLERHIVVITKAVILTLLWSICYWLCFMVTYGYNAYFWDNSIAGNLIFSAACWWLFGMWVIGLVVLFSVIGNTGSAVLLSTAAVVFCMYFLGIIPRVNEYLPTHLMDGNSLIYGTSDPSNYYTSIIITTLLLVACYALSIPIFSKKKL